MKSALLPHKGERRTWTETCPCWLIHCSKPSKLSAEYLAFTKQRRDDTFVTFFFFETGADPLHGRPWSKAGHPLRRECSGKITRETMQRRSHFTILIGEKHLTGRRFRLYQTFISSLPLFTSNSLSETMHFPPAPDRGRSSRQAQIVQTHTAGPGSSRFDSCRKQRKFLRQRSSVSKRAVAEHHGTRCERSVSVGVHKMCHTRSLRQSIEHIRVLLLASFLLLVFFAVSASRSLRIPSFRFFSVSVRFG